MTSRHATGDHEVDSGSGHSVAQVRVPAQSFLMGDQNGDARSGDGETPVHEVEIVSFEIDATAVTNADFARFVTATQYVTEAERFGFSAVFHRAVAADESDMTGSAPGTPWWLGVKGADWRHPGGRHSNLVGMEDHPVTHVSWNDASAYAAWAHRALPTEAQWEAAARGGRSGERFPWGNDRVSPDGGHHMNVWQGDFPRDNTLDDGYLTTAPVRTYTPNRYGLWQMVGNVWEWCADWWSADYYSHSPRYEPHGPATGRVKVLRGGSYLCHESYCTRYRNAARSSNTPDSSMGNAGFRTVAVASTAPSSG